MTDQAQSRTIPVIALLTDFGLQDGYVGVMKGVILSICPTAQIIDISHHIAAQDIRQGAYVLLTAYRYMPPGTIFVCVVDPGVGTSRRPVAVQTSQGIFIGPDNGLFSYVFGQVEIQQAVALQNRQYHLQGMSTTFHGRDIFSPVAAHMANGVPIDQIGPALTKSFEKLPPPLLQIESDHVRGEVLYIDHFGNVVTSIGRLVWGADDMLQLHPQFGGSTFSERATVAPFFAEATAVEIAGQTFAPLGLSYMGAQKGSILPLINSAGQLELAVNQGSAAQKLGVAIGDPVILHTG
ncbi:MAG: SAM-dependent chlorinase/fluorinase [Chloroflexi bacterium]|nr:SAM-dependent chlorinase/fluorinase [Chloroflexota bacterium]